MEMGAAGAAAGAGAGAGGGGTVEKAGSENGTESLDLDLLNLRCLLDCQVISNKHSKVRSTSKNSQIQMIFKDMRPQ